MKQRFILFRRAGVFYSEDTTTRKQISLRTRDEAEAQTLLHSKNEAHRQPVLNLHIARTYLAASDAEIGKRTWQAPMDEMTRTKTGPTLSSEDLPTFERPMKANSGSDSSGHESKSGALQSKMADEIFTMENPQPIVAQVQRIDTLNVRKGAVQSFWLNTR